MWRYGHLHSWGARAASISLLSTAILQTSHGLLRGIHILYEPMKELHDKFPAWLEANREKVSKEDLGRYEEQHRLVTEIVGKFEEKGYSDEKVEAREYIVDKMQKVCLL